MALPKCVVKAEALLQAFGLSVGSCGLANVLTTVGWQLTDLSYFAIHLRIQPEIQNYGQEIRRTVPSKLSLLLIHYKERKCLVYI